MLRDDPDCSGLPADTPAGVVQFTIAPQPSDVTSRNGNQAEQRVEGSEPVGRRVAISARPFGVRLAASFFGDRFELGDHLENCDAPCRAFDLNQTFERQAAAGNAEEGEGVGVRQQRVVAAATGDFSQNVNHAEVGH